MKMKAVVFVLAVVAIVLCVGVFLSRRHKWSPISVKVGEYSLLLERCGEIGGRKLGDLKADPNPPLVAFADYMTVTTLDAYQALFLAAEYPRIDDNGFRQWVQIRDSNMTANALFEFTSGQVRYAAVQYTEHTDAGLLQSCFLAKNIGGRWYPVSKAQNVAMRPVKQLFVELRPAAFQLVSGGRALEKDETQGADPKMVDQELRMLRHDCVQGRELNGDALSAKAKPMAASKNPAQRTLAKLILLGGSPGENEVTIGPHDREIHAKLIARLTDEKYTNEQTDEVVKSLKAGRYLEAAQLMRKYSSTPGASLYDFVQTIRTIYGADKIKVVDSAGIDH